MEEQAVIERLIRQVQAYAGGRTRDVERGAETPRLAALLVQKYGQGMVDAVVGILGSHQAADRISNEVDAAVTKIDPLWREHDRDRWAARPADITTSADS